MTTEFRRHLPKHYAACASIVAAPLLLFMDANYTIFATETLVLLGLSALIAAPCAILASFRSALLTCAVYAFLIALFVELMSFEFYMNRLGVASISTMALVALWPVRRILAPLLVTVFGVFNLTTLGIALAEKAEVPTMMAEGSRRTDLPVIVHIVLDEQTGLDGLTNGVPGGEDLRTWLLTYLESERFAVFGRAHSRFFYTRDSIPSALNFGMHETPESLYSGKSAPYIVRANEYFRLAREKGYAIHVYQTAHLDFCNTPHINIEYCHTYSQTRPSGAAWNEIGVFGRSEALGRIYAWSSFPAFAIWSSFKAVWDEFYPENPAPRISRDQWSGVAPIGALAAFDRLIEDVAKKRRGTLYFAHILLPHNPFIFDPVCRVRDTLLAWRETYPSTAQARHERYTDYFDQVRCTFRKIEQLLHRMKAEGILEDARIVIHGDHGSRIGSSLVDFENRDRLTARSYLDAFSTLVAIRAPEYASGHNSGLHALPDLLREFATARQERVPEEASPFVYLTEGDPRRGLKWHRVPYTAFGGVPRDADGRHAGEAARRR